MSQSQNESMLQRANDLLSQIDMAALIETVDEIVDASQREPLSSEAAEKLKVLARTAYVVGHRDGRNQRPMDVHIDFGGE